MLDRSPPLPRFIYRTKRAYLTLISHPDKPRRLSLVILAALVILFCLSRVPPRSCSSNVPAFFQILYCGNELVASRPIQFQNILVVYDAKDHSRTTPHSYIDFSRKRIGPASEIVEHILQKGFRDILLLGLGGAAMPFLITDKCNDCVVTAIDNSKDALYIARQYGKSDQGNYQLKYILEDAEDYVKSGQDKSHDVVIADLSVGVQIPDFIYDPSFIANVHRLIKDRGQYIVMLYMPNNVDHGKMKLYAALSRTFKSVAIKETEHYNPHFILVASK